MACVGGQQGFCKGQGKGRGGQKAVLRADSAGVAHQVQDDVACHHSCHLSLSIEGAICAGFLQVHEKRVQNRPAALTDSPGCLVLMCTLG